MTHKLTALTILVTFLFSPLSYIYAEETADTTQTQTGTEELAEEQAAEENAAPAEEPPTEDSPEEPVDETAEEPSDTDTEEPVDPAPEESLEEQSGTPPETSDPLEPPTTTETENIETPEETPEPNPEEVLDPLTEPPEEQAAALNTEETPENATVEESTETPLEESAETETTENIENSTEGDTGSQGVEGDGAEIATGASIAAANILNIVNTNMVNSEGIIAFLSTLQNPELSLVDLRDYIAHFTGNEQCSEVCMEGALELYNSNQATVQNSITLDATTGDNTIVGDNGEIMTGDAYANLNLTNLVNTNIVDSNYLLFTFSSFGDWDGDVVFPGESFFSNIFSIPHLNTTTITTENVADVATDAALNSDTGANTTGGEGSITTGNAHSNTSIFNYINQNMSGSGSFSVIFRVHGDWVGDIFSLPEGMQYARTGNTLQFMFESENPEASELVDQSVTIETENSANVTNTITLTALTGNNTIEGLTGSIETGDSYTNANVTNIVNTNIVSRNWILAIVDVFGDWNGDIAFGRPDLWVGETITAGEGGVRNGSTLTYTYTLMNNGDTTATDVVLRDEFNSEHVTFLDSSLAPEVVGETIDWSIDSLAPGEVREITYTGKVNNLPYGETEITNTVSLAAHEPDENTEDNTDTATIVGMRPLPRIGGVQFVKQESDVEVTLSRAHDAPVLLTAPQPVQHAITVVNESDEYARGATLYDTITAPDGSVFHTEVFEFGDIAPNEKITARYTIEITDYMTGTYTHTATLVAEDDNDLEIVAEPSVAYIHMLRELTIAPLPTLNAIPEAHQPVEAPTVRRADIEAALSLSPPIAQASDGTSESHIEGPDMTALAMRFGALPYSLLLGILLLVLLGYEVTRNNNYK